MWYSTGTVAVTNNSKNVVGTGTSWFDSLQNGWGFIGPDGRIYEVESVNSATSLTLRTAYMGASAGTQTYSAFPTMSLAGELVDRLNTLISGFQGVKDGAGAGKFGNGTVAAPGVSFLADQDTGLYRPADNELGFATGGVKRALLSSTALTVDVKLHATAGMQVTGNLAIGASGNFNKQLVVSNGGAETLAFNATSEGAEILGYNFALGGTFYQDIRFRGKDLKFDTMNAERVRIDSTGKVGIGTTSPSNTLQVQGNLGFNNSAGAQVAAIFPSLSGTFRIQGQTNEAMTLWTNNAERMRIDSAGKVGIGASAPDKKLHVLSPTSNDGIIIANTTAGTSADPQYAALEFRGYNNSLKARITGIDESGSNTNGKLGFWTGASNALSQRMHIDETGNVGIGTITPTTSLHIQKNAHSVPLRMKIDNGGYLDGASAGIELSSKIPSGWAQSWSIDNHHHSLKFALGGSERMRIDNSGNLGLGTTAPQTLLHLSQAHGATLTFERSASAAGNGAISSIGNSGVENARITLGGGTNNHMAFNTNGSERMRISSSGDLLVGRTAEWDFSSANTPGCGLSGPLSFMFASRENNPSAYFKRYGTDGEVTRFYKNLDIVGNISVTASATSYNTASDYRLKENVEPIAGAADRLKALKPSRFNFIDHPEKTVDGFIAHEVQEVVPEAVTGEKDGEDMQAMDAAKLVPLLTAALQEALGKIEQLETRIDQLEASA